MSLLKNIMKKVLKKVVLILCFIMLVSIFLLVTLKKVTFADAGFSTSYDSGGSSGWSSGSSWRSSSSDYGYSSHRGYYDDTKDSEMTPKEILIFATVLIAFLIYYYFIKGRFSGKEHSYTPTTDVYTIEYEIKKYIPDFDKEKFLNEGYITHCEIQDAWMNFKLEDIRDKITDELFSMYEAQLATLEAKGEQNVMKDFSLIRSFLKDVVCQNNTITITTGYVMEFYDYIADKETGAVHRGSDTRKMRVTYEMKFRKTLNENEKIDKCPNCGAEIDINNAGICTYCRTKLVSENTKWVLTEKTVKNQELI